MRKKDKRRPQSGFTIVELLIVIVIIGILAAITIVAYNGIQQRAKTSTVMADLTNSAKKMALDNVNNGSYALSAAAVDGGKGLPTSAGTTYQFHSTGSTYCVTGTNGTVSYKISDTATTPTAGGCAGDGQGGVAAVTNLVINPSAEVDLTGWSNMPGTAGSVTANRSNGVAQSGSSFGRMTWTAAPTDIATTGIWIASNASTPNAAGLAYTASAYVRTSWAGGNYQLNLVPYDASWAYSGGEVYGQTVTLGANTWTKLSVTMNSAPANTANMTLRLRAGGGTLPSVNSTLDGDAFMLTQGTTTYNYADGNSPNWIWNGTSNSSTSTGPSQ